MFAAFGYSERCKKQQGSNDKRGGIGKSGDETGLCDLRTVCFVTLAQLEAVAGNQRRENQLLARDLRFFVAERELGAAQCKRIQDIIAVDADGRIRIDDTAAVCAIDLTACRLVVIILLSDRPALLLGIRLEVNAGEVVNKPLNTRQLAASYFSRLARTRRCPCCNATGLTT